MEEKNQSLKGNKDNQKALTMVLTEPSSRIFRVSRASGGKDRHSKVFTSKGLRDRRVRLSVSTAIQFYDLQDRLGFDQPSKAIEWLINASSSAISDLPSLVSSFPENACSSNSETSKSSVLSLSRSEIRVKARERARIRAAKDKLEKKKEDAKDHLETTEHHSQEMNERFTEILSADYFARNQQLQSSLCFAKGATTPIGMMPTGDSSEIQQFLFKNDHMDYNLNFSIAQGRTLQSNLLANSSLFSPSSSSSMDVQNLSFIFDASADGDFHSPYDSRLQLNKEMITPFCLDGYRPSDLKGKRKG